MDFNKEIFILRMHGANIKIPNNSSSSGSDGGAVVVVLVLGVVLVDLQHYG